MTDAGKCSKGVPLACGIALSFQESRNQVCGVGDKSLGVLVNRCNSEDSVLPDIGMAVLKTRPGRGEEWLDELRLPQLAEEPQGVAPDVLIGMLQIISNTVTT